MANVPITPGSGTIIATDTVTADSSNVQIVQAAKVVGGVLTRTPLPALGTAGTPSADVITVQGVASGAAVPVSGTVTTSPPANASTNVSQVGGAAVALGAALSAASIPVALATDGTVLGPVNETAPASDTASSGLNGRLQRIAQRLSSIIALLPAALGQGTMAQSLRVVVASDQSAIPVSQPGLGGGILQKATTVGTTAVPVPAAPLAGRATMIVQNVGATTIYLGSSTVTADTAATGGLQLLPGQSVPIDLSSAVLLYAISSAAGGLVQTTEVAA